MSKFLDLLDLAGLSDIELFKVYSRSVDSGCFVGSYDTFVELVNRGGFELEREYPYTGITSKQNNKRGYKLC